jgi:hypothetical protein
MGQAGQAATQRFLFLFTTYHWQRRSPARPNGQLLSVASAEVFRRRRKVVVGLESDFCNAADKVITSTALRLQRLYYFIFISPVLS